MYTHLSGIRRSRQQAGAAVPSAASASSVIVARCTPSCFCCLSGPTRASTPVASAHAFASARPFSMNHFSFCARQPCVSIGRSWTACCMSSRPQLPQLVLHIHVVHCVHCLPYRLQARRPTPPSAGCRAQTPQSCRARSGCRPRCSNRTERCGAHSWRGERAACL